MKTTIRKPESDELAPVPLREDVPQTTWAMRRLENEAAKFREAEPTLTREQAVVKASARFPKLVQMHRALLRSGVVEPRDDLGRGDAPPEKPAALAELRVKARELRHAQPEITEAQAMVRASHEHPELVQRYREDSGFLRTSAL